MKLNWAERFLMNNPVRAAVQRHIEAADFARLGGRLHGDRVLEVGCGRGTGVELLIDRLEASEVHAFDLDPKMVSHARSRLTRRSEAAPWSVFVGDATAIPIGDATYDAVIDWGALHHVVNWRSAVSEIRRVLRPGGRFYFFEVTQRCLERWVVRTLLEHPQQDRFDAASFAGELESHGIEVWDRLIERWRGDVFVGVGIARQHVLARPST